MERFVLQKYTFRFGLAIRFVLRIIKLLERFSKSYRKLQDSWNKSRILGGF